MGAEKWGRDAWLATVAIVISGFSLFVTYLQTDKGLKTEIRPILVVVYEQNTGWEVRNVGNGPALNLVVADKTKTENWTRPVRIPPLGVASVFRLKWLAHKNTHSIGVQYEDLDGRVFTSECVGDKTTVFEEATLPQWPDCEIGRHWWVDPTQATRPGEL